MSGFNALHFPLTGRRLIEASAGTGKTFNIANLYLRLVLGNGFDALSVDQILVVTFTKAATEELRGRIRDKIEKALHAFRQPEKYRQKPESERDGFIVELLTQFTDAESLSRACRQLNAALVCMDEAAIFTIHSFAVRAIQSFLFETGALADVELSEAGNERKEQVIADLWRELQINNNALQQKYFKALNLDNRDNFKNYFYGVGLDLQVLPALDVDFSVSSLADILTDKDKVIEQKRQTILAERQVLAGRWQQFYASAVDQSLPEKKRDDAFKKLVSAVIDFPIPDNDKPQTSSGRVIKKIEEWSNDKALMMSIPSGDVKSRIHSLLQSDKADELSLLMKDWFTHALNEFNESAYRKATLKNVLVQWLQAKMAQIDLSSMQLDEVIRLINNKLEAGGDAAIALRKMITKSYSVCMVDEFQDTDPQQFKMFNSLYETAENAGFFMIGDPKQSIYAFRGADIFSYLNVRQKVKDEQATSGDKKIFSLDTNFRSKQQLIAATNALFAEQPDDSDEVDPVFVYAGIEYHPVKSCEAAPHHANKGDLLVNNSVVKPLIFIGNPFTNDEDNKINGDTLRWQFAHDTAQRISALLHGKHSAMLKDPGGSAQPLRAGDIAILVKTGREARILQQTLREQPIPLGSVYQSQRDSVFASAEMAEDIYHLLRAMNEPSNKRLLKTAIVTPLYRGYSHDFKLLDTIENGTAGVDDVFELLIDEFSRYKMQWEKFGVLTALNELMRQRDLANHFVTQPNCDRLITDFRHLGDLLQQQYLACGSPEQLIDWYARQLKDDGELEEDAKRIRLESDENLVKIVTIHVSKGLEYPVVFLPFFFLPFKVDVDKKLPLLHREEDNFQAMIDFDAASEAVKQCIQREQMAEDMRLLYVAITRAKFQCYMGVSASTSYYENMFPQCVWAHLLGITEQKPDWPTIKQGLQSKLEGMESAVEYSELYACEATPLRTKAENTPQTKPLLAPKLPAMRLSPWLITSYSKLAHARKEVITRGKDDERVAVSEDVLAEFTGADFAATEAADKTWLGNIRFALRGSADTGQCLHGIYEEISLNPALYFSATDGEKAMANLVERQLTQYGLLKQYKEKPEEAVLQIQQVKEWMLQTLAINLTMPSATTSAVPSLQELFKAKSVLPELKFDFALGSKGIASIKDAINPVLQAAGLAGIHVPSKSELQGFMNGAIDLVFIHDKKVYVLDYKSNTLGKSPRFYQHPDMSACMQTSRYDLQYMIYSVAVHRYFKARFASQYAFDNDSGLSFGGVFYLFVRGMGIAGHDDLGIWYHRPQREHIEHLDAALNGELVETH